MSIFKKEIWYFTRMGTVKRKDYLHITYQLFERYLKIKPPSVSRLHRSETNSLAIIKIINAHCSVGFCSTTHCKTLNDIEWQSFTINVYIELPWSLIILLTQNTFVLQICYMTCVYCQIRNITKLFLIQTLTYKKFVLSDRPNGFYFE